MMTTTIMITVSKHAHKKMAHTDSNEYFKKNTSQCTKTAHFDTIFDQLRLRKMIKIVATDVRF